MLSVTQQGTVGVPGGIDAARLARMGGFGLLFYGPYQCVTPPASRETTLKLFLQGEWKPLPPSAGFQAALGRPRRCTICRYYWYQALDSFFPTKSVPHFLSKV